MTTYLDQAWPKVCRCCDRDYTEAQFLALTLRGHVGAIRTRGQVQAVELRSCVCTNTLAVEVVLELAKTKEAA